MHIFSFQTYGHYIIGEGLRISTFAEEEGLVVGEILLLVDDDVRVLLVEREVRIPTLHLVSRSGYRERLADGGQLEVPERGSMCGVVFFFFLNRGMETG
jgi:hypothetical protein